MQTQYEVSVWAISARDNIFQNHIDSGQFYFGLLDDDNRYNNQHKNLRPLTTTGYSPSGPLFTLRLPHFILFNALSYVCAPFRYTFKLSTQNIRMLLHFIQCQRRKGESYFCARGKRIMLSRCNDNKNNSVLCHFSRLMPQRIININKTPLKVFSRSLSRKWRWPFPSY